MPDYSFLSQPQVPNSFQRIGEMVNFARGATELQKERATMQANIERAKAESSSAQTAANVAAQTAQPTIQQAQQAARQAEIKTNLDKFRLTGDYAQRARDIGQQLVSDPDVVNGNAQGIIPKIRAARQMMVESGVPQDVAEVQASHLISAAAADPKNFRQLLLNSIQAGLGSSGQAAVAAPSGPAVSNQQQTAVINTNPLAGMPTGQPIPGTVQQQQLPPTTPVFNTNTNSPGYLGPQPAPQPKLQGTATNEADALRMVQDASKRGQGASVDVQPPKSIQSGPALGQALTEENKAKIVGEHFNQAAANVASSGLLEGIAQNIKTYGAQAIVGTEQDRLAFMNGLLEKLGIPGASDLKTATDLMEKNMGQLAKNSPAATDAARVVNQLASPHPTMNARAISEAADQIIGQVRMSKDVYKTFLPLSLQGDNKAYLEKLKDFSEVADPRVWQFEALGPQERASMVGAMKPEDRTAFKEKILKAEKMGFFK